MGEEHCECVSNFIFASSFIKHLVWTLKREAAGEGRREAVEEALRDVKDILPKVDETCGMKVSEEVNYHLDEIEELLPQGQIGGAAVSAEMAAAELDGFFHKCAGHD